MSKTWHSPVPQVEVPITLLGWVRVALRGLALAIVTLSGLAVLLGVVAEISIGKILIAIILPGIIMVFTRFTVTP